MSAGKKRIADGCGHRQWTKDKLRTIGTAHCDQVCSGTMENATSPFVHIGWTRFDWLRGQILDHLLKEIIGRKDTR